MKNVTARPPRLRSAATALALLALSASCSTTRVVANRNPHVDFRGYATYGFMEPLGTDELDYGSLLSEFLKEATRRELEARGYEEAESPDLLVNFYLRTQERIRATPAPSSYFYFRRHGPWPYGVWGGYPAHDTIVRQYTEGTLHVDLVDAERRTVAWEAAVIGRFTEDDREDLRGFARETVAEAFEEYPFTAGGAAPAPTEP